MKPIDIVREHFERITAPSFCLDEDYTILPNGEYKSPVIEDHWQTFQEGWESCVNFLKNKKVSDFSDSYSDLISDGGYDIRFKHNLDM